MILISAFDLITPDPGLFIWTILIFVVLWALLGKYAFKPIARALTDREKSIEDALKSADKAREDMAAMQATNEKLLNDAREERSRLMKEAKETRDHIINEAKEKAKLDANKIVEDAQRVINNQKMAALIEVKNDVGNMAINIAEKVLKRELSDSADQNNFVKGLVDKINLN